MPVDLTAEPVPVAYDRNGVLRVAGTRVRLDTVIGAFKQGATAEEIAQRYPSLDLASVYAVIAFYLKRREEIEAYLVEQGAAAVRARAAVDAEFDTAGLRERLLARRRDARASA